MEELETLLAKSQAGDHLAYGEVVRRFQDMAYGYAYAILGDFHSAEDAAQEAFIKAYVDLPKLESRPAFPGWLRRIVSTKCARITRRKSISQTALTAAETIPAHEPGPAESLERSEMKENVLAAIRSLPQDQRTATTLFYINGYSQKDIAEFLELPVNTVKTRLHSSRKKLKERMLSILVQFKLK